MGGTLEFEEGRRAATEQSTMVPFSGLLYSGGGRRRRAPSRSSVPYRENPLVYKSEMRCYYKLPVRLPAGFLGAMKILKEDTIVACLRL